MPFSWGSLVRVLVLLAMAGHVFYLYSLARAWSHVVGLDAGSATALGLFALATLVPLAWGAIVLLDLPEIVRGHRGRRRWEQGCCPRCGYPLVAAPGDSCPECGAPRREPGSFWFGWSAVGRFVSLALAAWIIGCSAAEGWAWMDETSFAREGEAYLRQTTADIRYSRPRRWPVDQRLYYTRGGGISADPPLAQDL